MCRLCGDCVWGDYVHSTQSSHVPQVLHLIAANEKGGWVAWDFLVDNWSTLTHEYGFRCAISFLSSFAVRLVSIF